ncbi:glycosyltransferase family 32 protein [Pleomorphomonas sp. NRK KF1]|uniref:glycosyltransferase family 32 protein n=1 Tax=Pleomorphomonas sp. NRK KF1 TaxID=2943000 RepID=UPI0020441E20|nr:glycosyltransferase [Pleomorphomonas sp. NRK KF1]MCM5553337.1 hypothetical protein [Pleomorphomonas sp. NRK KF1]
MDTRSPDFENDDALRSAFVRELTLGQIRDGDEPNGNYSRASSIPKTLIRYWHNLDELPEDVEECFKSWDQLSHEGFQIKTFDDQSARAYIAANYGLLETAAFARCRHPAMRSDYLRMCFILAEGGMYVDADDVLLSDGWRHLFRDERLKLQPLCYDISFGRMVPTSHLWLEDLPAEGRVFYVNNDPLAAPAGHPLLARALRSSTVKLLGDEELPIIQATTGPGNMTIALAYHAHYLMSSGSPPDFELLRNWDEIAETRWDLSYRGDERNWRNVEGSGF